MREAEQMDQNNPYFSDEIDLKKLFKTLWAGKTLIILITGCFCYKFSSILPSTYQLLSIRSPYAC